MKGHLKEKFIHAITENFGIVHKVANIYFRNSEEREDVMQEMMFHLWKGYPSFRGNSKFSTWMYRVCLNTAITYLGKRKKTEYVPLSQPELYVADENTHKPDDSMPLLYKAIDNLSQINKGIILLYLEENSYEEISQITGLSKSNVSVRLVRIKKELEKELKRTKND